MIYLHVCVLTDEFVCTLVCRIVHECGGHARWKAKGGARAEGERVRCHLHFRPICSQPQAFVSSFLVPVFGARCALRQSYGSVWMYCRILLLEDLDWITALCDHPLYGFRITGHYIESWFLFAPRAGEPWIKRWLDTLRAILNTVQYGGGGA